VIISSSNAVNLTGRTRRTRGRIGDVLLRVLAIIGYWQFRHFSIYHLHAALDLDWSASSGRGMSRLLWWNAAPARIIMGDTAPRDRHRTRRVCVS